MTSFNYGLISDEDKLDTLIDKVVSMALPVGFDIETGYDGPDKAGTSLHPDDPDSKTVGISFTNDVTWARYCPVGHDAGRNLDPVRTARAFWRLLRTGLGVAHNVKFELRHLAKFFRTYLWDDWTDIETGVTYSSLSEAGERAKFTYAAEVRRSNGYYPFLSDTMIEAYLVAEHPKFGLKVLSKVMFGHDQADLISLFPGLPKNKEKALRFNTLELSPEVVAYACEDALWCLKIHRKYYPLVKDTLLYKTEMAVVPILCEMEDFGIKYDWAAMSAAARQATDFMNRLESEIMADLTARVGTPVSINMASTKQIGDILYGKLGMPVTKKTGSGAPSTDAIALTALAKKYPVVQKIVQWKELKKLVGTYLEKYAKEYSYAADGMTHPNHMQTAVPSGRFAVSDSPYQQTPKKYYYTLDDGSEFKLNFRSLIVAPKDHYIMGYDYSQIELRVMAGESGEPSLMRAFDHDEDVHTQTAALMLGVPLNQVTKDMRAIGKTMNFALLYGMGPKSLGDRLGISKVEAQNLYDKYFSSYSAISVWVDRTTREGKAKGFTTSKFGRRVTIWELLSEESWIYAKGERLCVNSPVQGGAADYMKISMVRADKALAKAGLKDKVHMVMNIHDALEFSVHKSVNPQQVAEVLAPAVTFPIPGWPRIKADWHVGLKWGEMMDLEWSDDQLKVIEKDVLVGILTYAPETMEFGCERFMGAPAKPSQVRVEESVDLEDPDGLVLPEVATEALRAVTAPRKESYAPDNKEASREHDQAATLWVEDRGGCYREISPGWKSWDAGKPHPLELLQESEGRCIHCGMQDSQLHFRQSPEEEYFEAAEEGKLLRVTLSDMPDGTQFARFLDLVRSVRGNNTVVLDTPDGELLLENADGIPVLTGLSTADQPQVSMSLKGARVTWDAGSVGAAEVMEGMNF